MRAYGAGSVPHSSCRLFDLKSDGRWCRANPQALSLTLFDSNSAPDTKTKPPKTLIFLRDFSCPQNGQSGRLANDWQTIELSIRTANGDVCQHHCTPTRARGRGSEHGCQRAIDSERRKFGIGWRLESAPAHSSGRVADGEGSRFDRNLNDPWEIVCARAGLEDVRIHDARHSYASRALALGESLPMIGRLLGHTRVETTSGYAHLADGHLVEAAEKVGVTIAEAMALDNPYHPQIRPRVSC